MHKYVCISLILYFIIIIPCTSHNSFRICSRSSFSCQCAARTNTQTHPHSHRRRIIKRDCQLNLHLKWKYISIMNFIFKKLDNQTVVLVRLTVMSYKALRSQFMQHLCGICHNLRKIKIYTVNTFNFDSFQWNALKRWQALMCHGKLMRNLFSSKTLYRTVCERHSLHTMQLSMCIVLHCTFQIYYIHLCFIKCIVFGCQFVMFSFKHGKQWFSPNTHSYSMWFWYGFQWFQLKTEKKRSKRQTAKK